jgi:hypothetical protein
LDESPIGQPKNQRSQAGFIHRQSPNPDRDSSVNRRFVQFTLRSKIRPLGMSKIIIRSSSRRTALQTRSLFLKILYGAGVAFYANLRHPMTLWGHAIRESAEKTPGSGRKEFLGTRLVKLLTGKLQGEP